MGFDRQKVYETADEFFALDDRDVDYRVVMKLSRPAAIDVCAAAADHGLLVAKIEGGIAQGNTFEARLDAIWDGADPPLDDEQVRANNLRGADFIRNCVDYYNAFIITDAPLDLASQMKRPRLSDN